MATPNIPSTMHTTPIPFHTPITNNIPPSIHTRRSTPNTTRTR